VIVQLGEVFELGLTPLNYVPSELRATFGDSSALGGRLIFNLRELCNTRPNTWLAKLCISTSATYISASMRSPVFTKSVVPLLPLPENSFSISSLHSA
jgi:hypothetical protein